mmetsp:Transcript_28037/g.51372  ORF Transcript_28037/g.51372 Transcript_28037/m.51372 type:complete len:259 (-) Transcript_28037:89-865(-)
MGSRDDAIVPYGRSRSRRRSRSRGAGRSRSRGRSRSKSGMNPIEDLRAHSKRMAAEKTSLKRFAKEQAINRTKAAASQVEAAQTALDKAIQESAKCQAAELEADKELQDAIREESKVDEVENLQRLVDERQDARRDGDFKKSDRLRDELRSLGVTVNDNDFSWTGPGGLGGNVQGKGATQRRPGDWDCPKCGMFCFASKDRCKKCGTRKNSDGGGRRSPSYSRRERDNDRGGGGRRDRGGDHGGRKKRRKRHSSSYSS